MWLKLRLRKWKEDVFQFRKSTVQIFVSLWACSEFRFGFYVNFYTVYRVLKIFFILLFKRVKFIIIDKNHVKFFIEDWLFLLFSILICIECKIKKKYRRHKIDVKFPAESKSEVRKGVRVCFYSHWFGIWYRNSKFQISKSNMAFHIPNNNFCLFLALLIFNNIWFMIFNQQHKKQWLLK